MIRFINIEDGVYPFSESKDCPQFSWWDTISDEFLTFNDEQMWDSWDDFEKDFNLELIDRVSQHNQYTELRERLRRLYPKEKP